MIKNPVLLQINTRVWFNEIKDDYTTNPEKFYLDSLPESVWESFKNRRFDVIYLLGVWQVDKLTEDIFNKKNLKQEFDYVFPRWQWNDTCGSPFSINKYAINPNFGNENTLENLKIKLNKIGLKLILDFVPNHFGLQTEYVGTSNFFIEEEHFTSSTREYSVIDTPQGKKAIYHGKDPYFPPWEDTFQLDYSSRTTTDFMKEQLRAIAKVCDGIRCDMAMLIVNRIIRQVWGNKIRGNLTSEFWFDAIHEIKATNPDFTFIAEVYWDMEEELLNLGFDYCYDKKLYDAIRDQNYGTLEYILSRDRSYHEKTVRFLENHDESRAIEVFNQEKYFLSAIITFTLPGIKFFHQKQFEAYTLKESLFLTKRTQEQENPIIKQYYEILFKILQKLKLKNSKWNNDTDVLKQNIEYGRNIYSWEWKTPVENKKFVVVINFKNQGSLIKLREDIKEIYFFANTDTITTGKILRTDFNDFTFELHPYGGVILEI